LQSAVSISDAIADFLDRATLGIAGTRDRDLVPHVHRPSGFRFTPDKKSVVCLFPEAYAEHLSSSLEDNGEIALTVSQAVSHETYQLKGKRIESGPVQQDDLRIYESCVERAAQALGPVLGSSEQVLRENVPPPTLRVVFEVREIYDQTPGPGAGRRVFPDENP
jgi:hypothetical protein